ncbi:hypothetical protein [Faecalibacterium hominis (ex Afrizal et al. 2022)]|uniref:hypothetical protein n=1 Tax=Faecalibacterium hominis (ex Afrizal et al. 2022) TaxID=2881265 RepID=UPI003C2D853A
MTNKLYDSKGQLIGYIRTVEKNQHDDLVKVILSTGHELVFSPCDLTSDQDGNWRIRSGALYPRCEGKKTASAMSTAAIKDVIFAPPATIVYWSDGSKTVVKCSENDAFDPEKGLAMAIAKRCGGNKGSYYKEIQNWVEKSGKKYPGKPAAGKAVDLDVLKKYSSEANKDFEKFLSAAMSNNQSDTLLHLTALVADLKILENEFNK